MVGFEGRGTVHGQEEAGAPPAGKGLKAIDEKAFQGKKKKKTLESVFADMGI